MQHPVGLRPGAERRDRSEQLRDLILNPDLWQYLSNNMIGGVVGRRAL